MKRAIVTVIGTDKIGIISHISQSLSEIDINVLDITQTVMEQYFAMIMLVDYAKSSKGFIDIKNHLQAAGDEIGMRVNIQREEIFDAMHNV